MDLNVQNKSFLTVLSKLDIDVDQFPDKTFDGLFENVPEITNFFFNWFIENISPDNALTQSEQSTYFHLQTTHSLPTEEELNYVLSSCNPSYEELMCLDINYINNYLSLSADDLKKTFEELSVISTNIETNFSDVKRKQNCLKEEINIKRKGLSSIKKDCHKMNLVFGRKIDEIKVFLLTEPHFSLDLYLFKELITEEGNIFDYFTKKLLENRSNNNNSKLDYLPKLREDLACIEISAVLSEGFYKGKIARIDFLSELLQKKESQKNFTCKFIQPNFVNNDEDIKIAEEVKNLETELFEKIKLLSNSKVQKIADHYLLNKVDLCTSYIDKITNCKNSMKFNGKLNSCLLHILMRCILIIENTLSLREELYSKLSQYETSFSNDITTLELRSQRYKEVSAQQNQHPLLDGLKSIMNFEENPENNEETFKKLNEMMSFANDDSYFTPHKFRSALQSSIKTLFANTLCGPTNQLLFLPIELLIKFQECEERENNLSQVVKRLASKYVGAKETISKSERRKLLLWLKVLTNPECLLTEMDGSLP